MQFQERRYYVYNDIFYQNLDVVVVEAELTITSGLKWNADLLNRNSLIYKQLSSKIVAQVAFLFLLTFWNLLKEKDL